MFTAAPYSAAKGGINALSASLAFEYAASGVGSSAPRRAEPRPGPGGSPRGTPPATSEREKTWFQTHIDNTVSSSLMKRAGTPDEQAAAICFLAAREASYDTVTVLPVAGGDLG
ncbi:hypothetical protein ACIQU4_25550 [Streptomyces sp. NPDC090741]|uniref:hypothetical protein n=1 Tax=Streptomyces sp. NPDC090741 TaxID=3365967 RepID=UPI00381E354C